MKKHPERRRRNVPKEKLDNAGPGKTRNVKATEQSRRARLEDRAKREREAAAKKKR